MSSREDLKAERASRNNSAGTDRYDGRHVDLGPLLAEDPKPIPWRVENVVADGTVTVISAESGAGKSWLAQAFCSAVKRGGWVAGLQCALGTALYVDAEMGPEMFVNQRLRPAGIEEPEFEYIDAMGLDISRSDDLEWLRSKIQETGANLVVIDSLRRLTPSKGENDSDDMAPVVAAIAKLARDTGAAILLIHHKGDSEKFYRGSTAIKDQADALFALLREGEEDSDSGVRKLRCRGGKGKMRYAPEPEDVFLTISPFDGGVAGAERPTVASNPAADKDRHRNYVKAQILDALPGESKSEVAEALHYSSNERLFREAWTELARSKQMAQSGSPKLWRRVSCQSDPREGSDMTFDTQLGMSGMSAVSDTADTADTRPGDVDGRLATAEA